MLLAAWLLPLVALLQSTTGPPVDSPQPPVISITAVVTDQHGKPVAGLTRTDFSVREEGTSRPVEEAEFRRGTGRLFAFFFDDFHVDAGLSTTRAREALASFLDEHARDSDRLIAMKPLDPIVAIEPTADRAAIREAVERFAGRKGDYSPRSAFEAEYMSRAPESATNERARVVLSDLAALAAQLGSIGDMPKAIVLITEGTGGDLRAVVRGANRAGVAVYVIDPRESPEAAAPALQMVARDTGGMLTAAGSDLETALVNIGKDLDAYYVLRYRSPGTGDGRFHAVEVAARRAGVQVRARRTYWSPGAPSRRAAAPATSFPLSDYASAHVSSLIVPWFRMTRGPDGRTRITFSWQPTPGAAGTAPARKLHLTAVTPDGKALFDGPVSPMLASSTAEPETPNRVVIDVPAGRLRTEMRISDGNARLLDRDVRFLDIPNLYTPGIVMTTPEILRTRTAREFRELSVVSDATPTSARDFNRFERLLIRVHAYGPGENAPSVTATLMNAIGQRLQALERVSGGTDGMTQFDLPLNILARGNYSIEIAAASGSSRASQMIPIRIIG